MTSRGHTQHDQVRWISNHLTSLGDTHWVDFDDDLRICVFDTHSLRIPQTKKKRHTHLSLTRCPRRLLGFSGVWGFRAGCNFGNTHQELTDRMQGK